MQSLVHKELADVLGNRLDVFAAIAGGQIRLDLYCERRRHLFTEMDCKSEYLAVPLDRLDTIHSKVGMLKLPFVQRLVEKWAPLACILRRDGKEQHRNTRLAFDYLKFDGLS